MRVIMSIVQHASKSTPIFHCVCLGLLTILAAAPVAAEAPSFLAFESGHVRPLALSTAGDRLYAVNTPDNRLEIFSLDQGGLEHLTSVPVGMEPVAVALRQRNGRDAEAWVVNHLSDSVSIVDLTSTPRVVRTLLVGDEPRDVVFAGPGGRRAFVTTARRGQHREHRSLRTIPGAGDPLFTTPGVGRADVWVFDAANLGRSLGGRPLAIVELFGDTPRGLAVSNDGQTVYAAVLRSGNQTSTVPEEAVCDGFEASDFADACPDEFPGVPGGLPGPAVNHQGVPAPETGLIVRYDRESGEWRDILGRDWSAALRFDLPDLDVFAIDAASLEPGAAWPHVGTVNFNIAVNPVSGKLYVTNTEASNEVRFEGPGLFGGSTVQGHLHRARITVIDPGAADPTGAVAPRHLNKHIDYSILPAPAGTRPHSLATPLGMALSSDGETLYVAAFGSRRIGVFPVSDLESDAFNPRRTSRSYIELSGGGPSGVVLDEARQRLYVITRFDNTVSAVDLVARREIVRRPLFNPEPADVLLGRRFLYDARLTSSNGEASCASCHIFGDLDGLAWDLGNPDGDVGSSPIPILREGDALAFEPPINGSGDPKDFHPMKGPMVTQSLRGIATSGALHWRGDRADGFFGRDATSFDLSFRNFIVAFEGLVGRKANLSAGEMRRFSNFVGRLVLPPNPIRRLDNSQTVQEGLGQEVFDSRLINNAGVGTRRCQSCHFIDPLRSQFGTRGLQSFNGQTQIFKIPHLRALYQKIGMFGMADTDFVRTGDNEHQGDQVRGFGFLHDGSVDTVFRFNRAVIFADADGDRIGFRSDQERRAVERFILTFPGDLAPIVGQQITLRRGAGAGFENRAELMLERARAPWTSGVLGGTTTECDVVIKGIWNGEARGAVYDAAAANFLTDRAGEPRLSFAQMRTLARQPGHETTFTCAPPGSGRRMGIDRDEDGIFDRDEIDAGSDPADAASVPSALP